MKMFSFTETLANIRRRHAEVVPTLAQVIPFISPIDQFLRWTSFQAYMEFEKISSSDMIEKSRIQYFYDRFFMNRIGVRTLIYQHSN